MLKVFAIWVLLLVALGAVLSYWTDNNLDFLLTYLKGHIANSPYWVSIVLLFFAPALLLANVAVTIFRVFVAA